MRKQEGAGLEAKLSAGSLVMSSEKRRAGLADVTPGALNYREKSEDYYVKKDEENILDILE